MDLMESVSEKPELRMLLLQEGVSSFFNCLCSMYKRVLKSTPKQGITLTVRQMEAVVEVFSKLFGQLVEKKEEEVVGVEMAMIELHAFEYFACSDWMVSPEHLSILRNPPPQMQPPLGSRDTDQTRPKFDESALVPAGQFIGQHPGSSTTRGSSVPNFKDGQLIKITVQSLSENVATLEIQIPANKHKFIGEAGFLQDNMSVAHYSVRAGDILTLPF